VPSVHLSASAIERSARSSPGFDRAVRWGLVGYGALHFLVAWVAIRIVLIGRGGSSQGALARVAGEPLGVALLVGVAAGFVVLTGWQAVAGLVGYRHLDGVRRLVMRLGAACRVVTYAYLGFSIARLLVVGPPHSGATPRRASAGVLAEPLGRVLLGCGGLVIAAIGIGLAVFGVRREFLDQVDEEARSGHRRVPIVILGQVGYVAKGAAFLIIAALVCWAAVTNDPSKAGGLDQSLEKLVQVPLGAVAVVAVGVGIACFGCYLIARAFHLNRRTLTS
jgi:type IV secretory pathway VirB2 component (pilin)